MAEYTPTTDDDGWPNDEAVRVMFVGTSLPLSYDEKRRAALYDRWLAAHDREVKAEAFDEGWVDRANREPWIYGKRTNDAPPPPRGLNPYRGA